MKKSSLTQLPSSIMITSMFCHDMMYDHSNKFFKRNDVHDPACKFHSFDSKGHLMQPPLLLSELVQFRYNIVQGRYILDETDQIISKMKLMV